MGRIKTMQIKRNSQEIFRENPGIFTSDFEENKKLVTQYRTIESKKLRNVIAGYLTRLAKQQD